MPTDSERLDFLERQRFTRWVGYTNGNGATFWPVFPGGDLRGEIDTAMRLATHVQTRKAVKDE